MAAPHPNYPEPKNPHRKQDMSRSDPYPTSNIDINAWPQPREDDKAMSEKQARGAFAAQVGGSHYKSMAIQPAEYCHLNGIGKLEGDVIAYVSRWRAKNGIEDLKKARHTLDLMIEMEERAK